MKIGDGREIFDWYGMGGEVVPAPDAIVCYPDWSFMPVMFHYAAETDKPQDIARHHGFDLHVAEMGGQLPDDDPRVVAYENGSGDAMRLWLPSAIDGWKLVGKSDTEDGPVAFYIRKSA